MATTAWKFRGTEGADQAVVRLKELDAKDLIKVQDATVIRWPHYAGKPLTHEHATDESGKMSSFVRKLSHPVIESTLIESVKGDITPGSSALVLLSARAEMGAVAEAFSDLGMELIRSDLSVQEEDQVRHAISKPPGSPGSQPPGR